MNETNRVPPSKIRYLQRNPVVSFHLPADLLDRLRSMAAEDGVTIATYVRRFLSGLATRDDEKKQAREEGYKAGYEDARRHYEIRYRCSVCGEFLTVSPESPCHNSIVKHLHDNRWAHDACARAQSRFR